jgi:hypothetical protein
MKKLILAGILILMSACGMNRPFTPTFTYIGNSPIGMRYANQQTGTNGALGNTYATVTDLAYVQLNWDVSNVPGANQARIIASRDYTCSVEVASVVTSIISTTQRNQLLYQGSINPEENMRTLFSTSIDKFTAGTYYICVRAIKMGKEGPSSIPATLSLNLNQQYYLKAGGDSVEEEKDNPYKDTIIKKEELTNSTEEQGQEQAKEPLEN